jgi:uncharacterized membrane protein YgcG
MLALIIVFIQLPCLGQGDNLMDLGKIFDSEQKKELNRWATDYEELTNVDISIVTIKTLNQTSLRDSSYSWVNEINLNNTKNNHSMLVFLVAREKKLDLHLGLGLEWTIPEERLALVKREMIQQFKYGDFVTGIKEGGKLLFEFTKAENFTMDFEDYSILRESQHLAIDRIVSFDVTAVTKSFSQKKIIDKQFHTKYFIYVHAPDNQLVKLHFTRNSYFLIKEFLVLGEGRIYGKISSTNPLDIDLYGITLTP